MFAYDYLFEQQGNSHDESLVNKAPPIKGHGMTIAHHLGQSSQDSENLSNAKITRGKSPPESLGAWDMSSSNESCLIKHLPVAWQNTSDRGNSLHSENVDIVEKILRMIKDPLG